MLCVDSLKIAEVVVDDAGSTLCESEDAGGASMPGTPGETETGGASSLPSSGRKFEPPRVIPVVSSAIAAKNCDQRNKCVIQKKKYIDIEWQSKKIFECTTKIEANVFFLGTVCTTPKPNHNVFVYTKC